MTAPGSLVAVGGYTDPARHGAASSWGLVKSEVPSCPGTEAGPHNLVLPPKVKREP